MSKYSILIDCPDDYLDILDVFFKYLNKNWPDRTTTIYVTTNEKDTVSPENVYFVKCGGGNTSIQRSMKAIELIKERHILILDCDCFISKKVDDKEMDYIVDYMINNQIKYVRIWQTINKEQCKYKCDAAFFYYCNKKARYCRSLMANFWEKNEYIKEIVSSGLDGWSIESQWLSQIKESEPGHFDEYLYYANNPLHILHSISKGAWIRKAYSRSLKLGFINKKDTSRRKLSFKETFKINLSSFFNNHFSAKLIYRIKRTIGRDKFVSED